MFRSALTGPPWPGAWLLAMMLVAAPAHAADAERSQLAEARQRIEADHARRVAQCRQRFVVTACVEAADAERREGLTALQTREAEIDDAERKARAQARQSRIDAKQQRQKDRPAPVPLVLAESAALEPESAASRKPRLSEARPKPQSPERPSKPKAVDTEQEAARFDARQHEALSRKAAAAERQKERERSGKTPRAPLPPVDAASAVR